MLLHKALKVIKMEEDAICPTGQRIINILEDCSAHYGVPLENIYVKAEINEESEYDVDFSTYKGKNGMMTVCFIFRQ